MIKLLIFLIHLGFFDLLPALLPWLNPVYTVFIMGLTVPVLNVLGDKLHPTKEEEHHTFIAIVAMFAVIILSCGFLVPIVLLLKELLPNEDMLFLLLNGIIFVVMSKLDHLSTKEIAIKVIPSAMAMPIFLLISSLAEMKYKVENHLMYFNSFVFSIIYLVVLFGGYCVYSAFIASLALTPYEMVVFPLSFVIALLTIITMLLNYFCDTRTQSAIHRLRWEICVIFILYFR